MQDVRLIEEFRPKYKIGIFLSLTGISLLALIVLVRFTSLAGWLAALVSLLIVGLLVLCINAEKAALDKRYFDYLTTVEYGNLKSALTSSDFSEISKRAVKEYLNSPNKKNEQLII